MAYHRVGSFIVETRAFTRRALELLTEDEVRLLQLDLLIRPDAGAQIPGTGGLRKLRWRSRGQGKRGGVRLIYFWHRPSDTILMLYLYAKNERDDLRPDQKAALRRAVERDYR